ncbi:MAG: type I restriction enzyme HsdR N-terminal domain-containing protein [Bacteroidaceae bacterium]|nr:type I restriction enzyme HsdR N-terminal domain-containing protein [Bacteroidaceae bacterium]
MEKVLNLPPAPLKTRQEGERTMVFDPLRKRYVALTPEEWVRQHFVHFLIMVKGYPASRIGNEISLKVGDMKKRCDTVVYDTQAKPLMIVEYKAPSVQITQKVFDQVWRYNLPLRVPYIIISNGLQHFCCKVDYENNKTEFLPEIPEGR